MTTKINWARLVSENRAKSYGIPWSREEKDALKKGISAEDVRAGILTKKAVVEADKKEKEEGKPLFRMKKDELVELAKKKGLKFDENAVTRAALMQEVSNLNKKNDEDKK